MNVAISKDYEIMRQKAAAWDVLVKISEAAVSLKEDKGVIVTPSLVGDCVHLEALNVSTVPGMKYTSVINADQFMICPERWVWRFVRGDNRPFGFVDDELTTEDLLGVPYVPEDDHFAEVFKNSENMAGPLPDDDGGFVGEVG